MRRAVVFAALLLFPLFASAATDRYVVMLKAGAGTPRPAALLRDIDGSMPRARAVAEFRRLDAFAADLTEQEAAAMRRAPGVRYVERVVERHILGSTTPAAVDAFRNPNGQTVPFGIDAVKAPDVWGVTRGETINVVVMDTGVDYKHPDLAEAWAGGYNAIVTTGDARDDHNHGSHVAGTIAAADNDLGVVGVAPNVRLWGVKVLNAAGSGTTDKLIAGIDWVIGQKRTLAGNWIINMSLGSSKDSVAEREAIARAVAEGILIIAASGNESTSTTPAAVTYPAAYPGVVAIGAVDSQLRLATFSNQGPELAAVAPGVDVLSSVRLGGASVTEIVSSRGNYRAAALVGSPRGTVSGDFVFCNLGRAGDFPASVAGRIAVIRRGEITFALKTKNAVAAGATAVVIVNHEPTGLSFTLIDPEDPSTESYPWPLTVAVSTADGERLISGGGRITVSSRADDYASFNGTSMATPHAAGIAALAWSLAPNATAADVANALRLTATDLGDAGVDTRYGHGILNALEAAKMMNPGAFGVPSTPDPAPQPSGRRVLRRGRG